MKKIVLIIMLVLLTMSNVEAGWKDNLKKIGKTTKRVTEGIKRGAEKTKEKWDKRESPCTQCGKNTKLGKLCAECKRKAVMNTSRKIGKRGKKIFKATKESVQKASNYTSKKYKRWSPVVEKKYGEAMKNIRDPEQRKKMKKALIKTTKIVGQIQQAKNKGVYLGLSKAMNLKLPENLGGKTLGEEMGERLIQICPELAGTGVDEDPALALTAVILLDPKYFAKDFKFIKRDGRNVSLVESVKMSSPFNASSTIKSFKVLAAAEQLAIGEGDLRDLVSLGNAINSVNK